MNRKYILWSAIILLVLLVAYIIYNRIQKKKQFNLLFAEIANVATSGGDYTDLTNSDAFNPNYYKGKTLPALWTSTENVITTIYDAKSPSTKNWVSDNEQSVVDLFRKFTTKSQVSYIADKFQAKHGKSLISYMNGFMVNASNPLDRNYMTDID